MSKSLANVSVLDLFLAKGICQLTVGKRISVQNGQNFTPNGSFMAIKLIYYNRCREVGLSNLIGS